MTYLNDISMNSKKKSQRFRGSKLNNHENKRSFIKVLKAQLENSQYEKMKMTGNSKKVLWRKKVSTRSHVLAGPSFI